MRVEKRMVSRRTVLTRKEPVARRDEFSTSSVILRYKMVQHMDSDMQSRRRHKGGWKRTPSCKITGIVVSFPFMTTCASATRSIPFLGNQLERVLLPASTAAVEWLFSVQGCKMTDRRNRLQPTTIRNAMLLRMNTILARKDKLYEDINEYTKEKTRVATKQSLFICLFQANTILLLCYRQTFT